MSDWENDSDTPAPKKPAPIKPVVKSKWADEDEDDGKGGADWDASSDEGSTKPEKLVTATAPRKKGTLKAKLAQKEAERAASELAGVSIADDFVEDEATKKARLKAAEIEADLGNAASLFGSSVNGDDDGTASERVLKLLTASPKTKDDFARLGQQVYDLLLKQHSHKPLYAAFVELFTRELCAELRDVETRKVASGLTALASEKTKEAKEKASGKGKKKVAGKPALGVGKPGAKHDTSTYEEALDDFGKNDDDFM